MNTLSKLNFLKNATRTVSILSAMAILVACDGENKERDLEKGLKSALNETGDGKTFNAAQKAKIESLGKCVKDERIVYWIGQGATRKYIVALYENGKAKSKTEYHFFYKFSEHSYAGVKKAYEGTNIQPEWDDANYWYSTKEEPETKYTWQKFYDTFKKFKAFHFVE